MLSRTFDVEKEAFLQRSRRSTLRAVASRFLILYSGLTQRDVAKILNTGSGAAVCNQLKSLPDKLKDRGLRKTFQKADDELKQLRKARYDSTCRMPV